ncbi:MAG: hypothetical protein U0414_05285 [Polyangiaceae bacterium]
MRGARVVLLFGLAGCAASPQYVYVLPEAEPASASPPVASASPSARVAAPPRAPLEVDQSTPLACIRSFVAAYRARRWDLLMHFIPDQERGGPHPLTEESLKESWEGPQRERMESVFAAIEKALAEGERIVEAGEVASMSYGSGGAVALLREGERWVVKDL